MLAFLFCFVVPHGEESDVLDHQQCEVHDASKATVQDASDPTLPVLDVVGDSVVCRKKRSEVLAVDSSSDALAG